MSQNDVLYMAKEALMTGLLVSAPILGACLLVGLTVSIFQAMTQIQEQTLTFVPKILAVVAVLVVGGSWMLDILTNFTINLFSQLATFSSF